MKYSARSANPFKIKTRCLVIPVANTKKLEGLAAEADTVTGGVLSGLRKQGDLSTTAGKTLLLYKLDGIAAERVILAGVGKPGDRDTALSMLAALSGRTHTVITGVTVRFAEHSETVLSTNEVRFRTTTAAEREAYCATSEPLDKAGGYAIQGFGAVFIEYLRGSYSAVMGLPLFETAALLRRFGIPAWLNADRGC